MNGLASGEAGQQEPQKAQKDDFFCAFCCNIFKNQKLIIDSRLNGSADFGLPSSVLFNETIIPKYPSKLNSVVNCSKI